jgi:hypothetical protein
VAYHDTTPGNTGSVYRSDDVDLQTATDRAAGTCTLTVRWTSAGRPERFHIEVDGVDRTGALTVPDASGWQAWRTLMVTGVPLEAGQRVIRLVLDSNGTSGAGGIL